MKLKIREFVKTIGGNANKFEIDGSFIKYKSLRIYITTQLEIDTQIDKKISGYQEVPRYRSFYLNEEEHKFLSEKFKLKVQEMEKIRKEEVKKSEQEIIDLFEQRRNMKVDFERMKSNLSYSLDKTNDITDKAYDENLNGFNIDLLNEKEIKSLAQEYLAIYELLSMITCLEEK